MEQDGTEVLELLDKWDAIDKNPLKQTGDVWFIVSKSWLDAFRLFISALQKEDSRSSAWPGPVDNSGIVEADEGVGTAIAVCESITTFDWKFDVKPDIPSEAFETVPVAVWQLLMAYFKGGPPIPRCCVADALSGVVQFETPIHISILLEGHVDALRVKVPPSLKYHELLNYAVKCLGLSKTVTWTLEDHSGDAPRNLGRMAHLPEQPTLQRLGVQNEMALQLRQDDTDPDSDVIMDEMNPEIGAGDGSDTVNRSSALVKISDVSPKAVVQKKPLMQELPAPPPQPTTQYFRSFDAITEGEGNLSGFAGLQNLGNTCFMNSALQCLTHCVPLLRVFLSSRFEDDLNPENPLGKKGEMAVAFGELAQKLWRGNVKHVSPDGFKRTLGRHAAQFQGYEQHDSQEFLSYLLDMLHEDLNRVRNKPYIEEGEDAGRSDEELAEEAWNSYRARNSSAIVDHFQGLLKSTLDCPNCGHHKRKFDPFMYLSVPLPGANTVLRRFTFVPMAGNARPQEYCVKVYKHDTVGALLEAVASLVGLPSTAVNSLTAVLQKNSSSHYSMGREYCTLDILEDVTKELPPERHKFSKDKLLVYHYPEDVADSKDLKLAAIVPPGGTDSLPLLLRVPGTAIAVESVSLNTSSARQFSSQNGLSLRSDCELARRVEDLLTPFKKQRVHSNLVYSPPSTETTTDSQNTRVSGEAGQVEVQRDSGDEAAVHVEMSQSPSDTTARLNASGGAVASAQQATSSLAIGVPVAAMQHLSDDDALLLQPMVSSHADDLPAGTMDEDCDDLALAVESEQQVEPSLLASAPDESRPMSLGACDSTQAEGVIVLPHAPTQPIMGCVPAPKQLDLLGVTAPPCENEHVIAGSAAPLHEQQAGVDGIGTAEATLPEPAVRLLAVQQDNGFPPTSASASGTQFFFRLDVRMEDAKEVIDVEAMTRVDEHSSLDQLKEHRDYTYTLEDCIGVRACLTYREPHVLSSSFHEAVLRQTYLAEEILGPTDLWHCPKCRMDVRAKKALDVWCLPEVLIIHLKRFRYSGFGYYATTSEKIKNLVTFPLQGLDMTTLVHGSDPEAVYDCFAVSNHMGSVSGGHYTAYCQHEQSLIPEGHEHLGWHSYNDRTVMPTSGANVVTPSAYVLFYRRRSCSTQDPPDMLDMCRCASLELAVSRGAWLASQRREMQQRKQETVQSGLSNAVVDLFPGKPRYAQRDSRAPSSNADSQADILADAGVDEDRAGVVAPCHEVSITGLSHMPVSSTVLQQFQDDGMESNDEADSQKAVVNSPTDPYRTIEVYGMGGTNHDTDGQGVGNCSPFDQQEDKDIKPGIDDHTQLFCTGRVYDDSRSMFGGVLVSSPSVKVNERSKSHAVLTGGDSTETAVQGVTDLPVARNEASDNDDMLVDGDCIEVDKHVHGLTSTHVFCSD